jgi:hypothetical protein
MEHRQLWESAQQCLEARTKVSENGAPIVLLEFTDPNHPGRRQQSKMLIETPSIQSTS